MLHPPRIYMPFWSAFIAASLAVGTFAVAFVVEANIEYRARCSSCLSFISGIHYIIVNLVNELVVIFLIIQRNRSLERDGSRSDIIEPQVRES
ncbi:hypothetical protein C8J56DRAFT_1165443 [Mycena floridula]|nr:hypothetical protein C8J56DRAFT_1165443 [Mycena floridula]